MTDWDEYLSVCSVSHTIFKFPLTELGMWYNSVWYRHLGFLGLREITSNVVFAWPVSRSYSVHIPVPASSLQASNYPLILLENNGPSTRQIYFLMRYLSLEKRKKYWRIPQINLLQWVFYCCCSFSLHLCSLAWASPSPCHSFGHNFPRWPTNHLDFLRLMWSPCSLPGWVLSLHWGGCWPFSTAPCHCLHPSGLQGHGDSISFRQWYKLATKPKADTLQRKSFNICRW